MNPQITQMGADFKPVEFDGFRRESLTPSNSKGMECFNRVEFEAVGVYDDFTTIGGSEQNG